MSLKIQIIVAIVLILALVSIINMVRKEALDIRFALSWLAVGVIVLILDIFPSAMDWLVHLLGIELPVNMMFFFGFCFTLLLLFILTVKVSKQEEQLKRLTQELALLEDRMNSRRLDKSICREANQMKGETCKKKDE